MKRIAVVLLALSLGGCATVGTGYRGVVLNWGMPTGEVKAEGISFLMPFSGYDVVPINVQTVGDEIKTNAASRDLQTVNTTVTVNYHLDPAQVVSIYDRLRTDYEQRIVNPTVHEAVKAATARFVANDLIAHRNEVRYAIETILRLQFKPYGIIADQVLITDFSFDPQFQKTVEDKVAAQQAQLTAKIESQTKYDQAVIDNKTKIANATADAQSNRLRQQTLTPLLLQQEAIKTWNGVLPTVTSGATPFINVGGKD